MPNPRVSLRHDQLLPVYMAVDEKEQLEKGLEEEEEEKKETKCMKNVAYFRPQKWLNAVPR
jgi:hypothetical protein